MKTRIGTETDRTFSKEKDEDFFLSKLLVLLKNA